MMTKINVIKNQVNVSFEDLDAGDYFIYDGLIHCKVKSDCANAFNVENGTLNILPSNAKVILIKHLNVEVVL